MPPHPRAQHYPSIADYDFGRVFRPFVTFVHEPRWRSPSVNIDSFGIREQYDFEDRFIDLGRCAESYSACTVMVGGSVAFGMGVSSDRDTIAAHLQDPGRPCINLAIRACASRQELAVFLALKHLLPRVESVVLFSGANECLMAGSPDVVVYPGYGSVFSELQQRVVSARSGAEAGARAVPAPTALKARPGVLARLKAAATEQLVERPEPVEVTGDALSFEERLDAMLAMAADSIETWSWIAQASGTTVEYVLQPVIPWCEKALTAIERECYQADLDEKPAVRAIAEPGVYERTRSTISDACVRYGVGFLDANEWFGAETADQEMFTDVAHLSDGGNAYVAARLRRELQCWSQ